MVERKVKKEPYVRRVISELTGELSEEPQCDISCDECVHQNDHTNWCYVM